jgi:rhamnulokinase
MSQYLALDLGAESGRGVLGQLENDRLELREIHRFPNIPVSLPDGLHWNILGLFQEIKRSIALASADLTGGQQLRALGVDTWGVDYALLGSQDELLGMPHHYRDHRTDGIMEKVFTRTPREKIFERTGIQFMQLNTLFQLAAARERSEVSLDIAKTLLFLPDLIHFWLSGEKACEFTIATTSQLFDPVARDWARDLMDELGIPDSLFLPIAEPGRTLGPLRQSVADELRCGKSPVVLPGSHDTAAAVAAVPADGMDFVYISSGTWSLIGVETLKPVLTRAALDGNFTNEGGVGGRFRFLKNIMGLWLVQECRRCWARSGQAYEYAHLASLAGGSPPFSHFVDPDEPSFLAPVDMPGSIAAFCRRTGQPAPENPGTMVRACLEGLAFKYRENVERLEAITGRSLGNLHIVGGGAKTGCSASLPRMQRGSE